MAFTSRSGRLPCVDAFSASNRYPLRRKTLSGPATRFFGTAEDAMTWEPPRIERADVERLLREFEARLMRMMGSARPAPALAARGAEGVGDMIATALGQLADRIGGRARDLDVGALGDDALRLGNVA